MIPLSQFRIPLLAFLLGWSFAGHAMTRTQLPAALASALDQHARGQPGHILRVVSPTHRLHWEGARGPLELGKSVAISPADAFRTASITKTFTAVVAFRLIEQGRLRLTDTLPDYLPPELVSRVHVTDGVPRGALITVSELLDHSSGLYDYATDPHFEELVLADPKHHWTPTEKLDLAMARGHPYFVPGAGQHYTDTGYVLLGLIIEKVTGDSLAAAYRRYILAPLGLENTYLEGEEPPTSARLSHCYVGAIDGLSIDASFDTYASGGLISTAEDLGVFVRAIFRGGLYSQPETLRAMLTRPTWPGQAEPAEYARGLQFISLDAGASAWGHRGFWGAFMYYVPAADVVVTGTTNVAPGGPPSREFLNSVMQMSADAVR